MGAISNEATQAGSFWAAKPSTTLPKHCDLPEPLMPAHSVTSPSRKRMLSWVDFQGNRAPVTRAGASDRLASCSAQVVAEWTFTAGSVAARYSAKSVSSDEKIMLMA